MRHALTFGLLLIIALLVVTRPNEHSMAQIAKETLKKQRVEERRNRQLVKEKIADRTVLTKISVGNQEYYVASGTIVSANGYVLSAAHVIRWQTSASLTVGLRDGREFNASSAAIIDADMPNDLLLLKLPDSKNKYDFAPILSPEAAGAIQPGEILMLAGHAYGLSKTLITDCKYIGLIKYDEERIWLDWFNAPGDSGGGVYKDVAVLGVFHGVNGGDGFSRISRAIANNTVRAFLDKNKVPYETMIEIE